jgi:phosphatidylglycerophosphate synthase
VVATGTDGAARKVSPFNPANAITAARALTFIPIWYCIHHGLSQVAVVILIVGGLADLVDGYVAKLFHCQSAFGEVFDALADGFLWGVCLILLAAYGWAPAPWVAVIFGLGVVNAVMRYVYARRVGRTTNYRSFAMERFVTNTAFLVGFGLARFETEFYFPAGVATMAVIVIHDAKRMLIDPVPR